MIQNETHRKHREVAARSMVGWLMAAALFPCATVSGQWVSMSNGTAEDLRGVWGSAPDNVFAVGMNAAILQYDGTNWSAMTVGGGLASPNLYDVWGSGPTDVFAVGEFPEMSGGGGEIISTPKTTAILHHAGNTGGAIWTSMLTGIVNGQTLHGVWGSGPNDVFAVGTGATVLHYNGTAWSQQTMPVVTGDLYGVWGKASNDVYAVHSSGSVWHYDGTSWSKYSGTGHPQGWPWVGLWGSPGSSALMFIVGDGGAILRRSSESIWSQVTGDEITLTGILYGVWVDILDNAYIVGEDGMTLRYTDSGPSAGLSQMPSGTTKDLWGVWGGGPALTPEVFAVGDTGTVLRYVAPASEITCGSCGAGTASLMPLMIMQLCMRKARLRRSRSRRQ